MKKLNRHSIQHHESYPHSILQFGGGNFLKGFVDWIIDIYNEEKDAKLGVIVVKPTARGDYQRWIDQDGLYHVLTKGVKNGQLIDDHRLISCVQRIVHPYHEWSAYMETAELASIRYIVSNTTESGIRYDPNDSFDDAPPSEFPAKLTIWLYQRYRHFNGSHDAGCIFIPTELLEDNGALLEECVIKNAENWTLEDDFVSWISEANIFCNTLVDKIIPGVNPEHMAAAWEQIGYEDHIMTQGEPYHFLAIEAPASVRRELPLDDVGLNIIFTDDLAPYRMRKVRILNGAHTSMVPVGFLYGVETVREAVEHEVLGEYIRQLIFEEIIPSLELPDDELTKYAEDVLDRFRNPFIHHELISISLQSTAKFRTRVLPSILAYREKTGKLPKSLIFSMAALIHFYKGVADGKKISLNDDPLAISFLQDLWKQCDRSQTGFNKLAEAVLAWELKWGQDLNAIPDFCDTLATYLWWIEEDGMELSVRKVIH